jgi:hypothetical protein
VPCRRSKLAFAQPNQARRCATIQATVRLDSTRVGKCHHPCAVEMVPRRGRWPNSGAMSYSPDKGRAERDRKRQRLADRAAAQPQSLKASHACSIDVHGRFAKAQAMLVVDCVSRASCINTRMSPRALGHSPPTAVLQKPCLGSCVVCLFVCACTCLPVIQQCEDLLAGRTARRCDAWAAARLEQLGDEAGPQQRGDLGMATMVAHGYHGDPAPRGGPVRLCHHGPVGRLPRCWIWRRCADTCRCLPLQGQFAVLDPSAPSLLARCRGVFTPTSRHNGGRPVATQPPDQGTRKFPASTSMCRGAWGYHSIYSAMGLAVRARADRPCVQARADRLCVQLREFFCVESCRALHDRIRRSDGNLHRRSAHGTVELGDIVVLAHARLQQEPRPGATGPKPRHV